MKHAQVDDTALAGQLAELAPVRARSAEAEGPAPGRAERIIALQRSVGNAGIQRALGVAPGAGGLVAEALRGPGLPLPDDLRTSMEQRMGADLSTVRTHTGDRADTSARALSAEAYTSGEHIVYASPHTPRTSPALLAHELAHVLQQRSGPVSGTATGDGLRVSDPADPYEHAAAHAVHAASSAGPAPQAHVERPATVPVQRAVGQKEDLLLGDKMAEVISAIITHGVLSKAELLNRGIAHSGSHDRSANTEVYVNEITVNGDSSAKDIAELVDLSFTQTNQGSFTVALETESDPVKKFGDPDPKNIAELAGEYAAAFGPGNEGLAQKMALSEARRRQLERSVEANREALEARLFNTGMVVVTDPNLAQDHGRPGVMESTFEGKIPPGSHGGFSHLIIPEWLRDRVDVNQLKSRDVSLIIASDVGKFKIPYRMHDLLPLEVELDAPDYRKALIDLLERHHVIQTHIFKVTPSASMPR
ncbi:DUF4157 domain-containing protein [Streptomyces goshikiensis]|uniref:eCIS core domain-containing protein n=1 Tax=Streptomyces goshikiensis TaxID=1942 RepID=UPI0036A5A9C2